MICLIHSFGGFEVLAIIGKYFFNNRLSHLAGFDTKFSQDKSEGDGVNLFLCNKQSLSSCLPHSNNLVDKMYYT